MYDWIGHFIANWPVWAVTILIILLCIVWFLYQIIYLGVDFPRQKKEWWQDREARLKKEATAKKLKQRKKN
jgi:hypothetical protein